MMRSAAKLSYEQAQAAIDGSPTTRRSRSRSGPPKPLWAAYAALARARAGASRSRSTCRSARCFFVDDGSVDRIAVPPRLDAHRLIEEFMIQANVAAAETLEAKRARSSIASTTSRPGRSSMRCAISSARST